MEQAHVRAAQVAPTQVVYQVAPHMQRSNVRQNYAARWSKVLGSLQVIIGILCISFHAGAIVVNAGVAFIGAGIWCGVWFILAGGFGIGAGQNKTTCYIVTFMILSIIAALLTIPLLTFSSIGLANDANCYRYCSHWFETQIAMNVVLICLAIVEGIVAIGSSAICCAGACCGGATSEVVVPQYVTTLNGCQPSAQAGSHPQVIMLTPTQTPGGVVFSGLYQGQQTYYIPQGPNQGQMMAPAAYQQGAQPAPAYQPPSTAYPTQGEQAGGYQTPPPAYPTQGAQAAGYPQSTPVPESK